MTPEFIRYSNQGATRNQPLSPQMYEALGYLGDMGVQMEVFSGGQPGKGTSNARVGSVRHDHGNAADVFFYKDGQRLDWANPEHIPIYQEIVRRGREAGLTGFGAGEGYMQPGSMHIGFGAPAVWGAGGRGANAPQWLREAYYGANAPAQPVQVAQRSAPAGGAPVAAGGGQGGLIGSAGSDRMSGLLGNGRPESFSAGLREAAKSGALWEGLATAFNSLRHNPDPGLNQMMAQRAARRDDMQSRNRTAEWLRSQGMGQYADAIEAGGMSAAQAIQLAQQEREMAMAAAAPQRPIVTDGGLVLSPDGRTVIGDYRNQGGGTAKPYTDDGQITADLRAGFLTPDQAEAARARLNADDQSAAEAKLSRMMEVPNPTTGRPFTRQEAIEMSEFYEVVTDPATGQPMLVNKADLLAQQQGPQGAPAEAAPAAPTEEVGRTPDYEGANLSFGLLGAGARLANTVSDAVTGEVLFPEIAETQSDFKVLGETLLSDLARGYDRQPPSWALQAINDLIPRAGRPLQGRQGAKIAMESLQAQFNSNIQAIEQQLEQQRLRPEVRQRLELQASSLRTARDRVATALQGFEGGGGSVAPSAEDAALFEKYGLN